jgi:hypothetical protein
MIQTLLQLIFYVLIFAVIVYGLCWICIKFSLPEPVLWIVCGTLLLIMLIFAATQLGVLSEGSFFHRR